MCCQSGNEETFNEFSEGVIEAKFPQRLFTLDANRQTQTPSKSDPLRTSGLKDCSMLMT